MAGVVAMKADNMGSGLRLPKMITLDELAARSGESRRTIDRRVEHGLIKVKKYSRRCTRVTEEEALKYLLSRAEERSDDCDDALTGADSHSQ